MNSSVKIRFYIFVHIKNCLLLIIKHQAWRPCWAAMVCSMMDGFESLPKNHWVWDSSDQMDISPANDEPASFYRSLSLYWFWLGESWTVLQKCLLLSMCASEGIYRDVRWFPCWKQQPMSGSLLETALQEDMVLLIPGRVRERISIGQGKYFQLSLISNAEKIKQIFPILAVACECPLTPLSIRRC